MDWSHGHPDEEALESYSLGTMPDDEETAFEEHLLLCEPCQKRVEETDDYVRAVRTAAARLEQRRTVEKPSVTPIRLVPKLRSFFPVPLAGALAAGVLAVVFMTPESPRVLGTADVRLTASRGASTTLAVTAPAHHEIRMDLDADALPVRDRYLISLADGRGRVLWQTPATPEHLQVTYPAGCEPGSYWVRIADDSGALLREYGLRVE
ncbi:MAG: hypothetical protein R2729_24745 [Bryobacteraceae bacterium]